ncbi:MAG: TIGR03086 family metal-binding protein [Ilumatobacteraceae bacterium]
MSQEVIDRYTQLVNAFDARVQAASADSWGNPAPCDGWTAADVVGHVVGGMNGIVAGLTGGAPAQADPADPVGSWNAARDAALAAVSTADLSTTVQGPFGPQPAEQVIGRLMCTDILVHTWDLARAVGGDELLDADAVAGAYSGLKPMDAMIRMPGVFGPKIEAAEGDDAQTEFLKFLGRSV